MKELSKVNNSHFNNKNCTITDCICSPVGYMCVSRGYYVANRTPKWAFTLAEILITLGIIGVVAALTMPSLISKHQHKVLETAFKKSYSNLANSVNMVISEYGIPSMDSSYSASSEEDDFYKTVLENFQTVKSLSTGYYRNHIEVKGYTKKSIAGAWPTQSQIIITRILSDGSAIGGMKNSLGYYFTVDTNGPSKGPNSYGHDIFIFIINSSSNGKLIGVSTELPYKVDADGNTRTDFADGELYYDKTSECTKNSTSYSNGFGCTPYAIKNVCPDDNGKTYWECLP